jgi:hypothetical protein
LLTLREVVARALADVEPGRHVAFGAGLADAATSGPRANGRSEVADVGLVHARVVTPKGDVILDAPPPAARELWAVVDPVHGAVAESLSGEATARVTRVYHPLAVAEVGERGLVVRRVRKGTSAREVAAALGVACAAGPDLAEWA